MPSLQRACDMMSTKPQQSLLAQMMRGDLDVYILDIRRHSNTLIPIARLTSEILLLIFKECRAGSLQLWHAPWIAVTQVCHHWRVLALSTPTLWNVIPLEVGYNSFPRREVLLPWRDRAGKTLLSIHVYDADSSAPSADLSPGLRDVLAGIIFEQLPRAQRFEMGVVAEFPESEMWPPSKFPLLEHLALWNTGVTQLKKNSESLWRLFGQRFPALKTFTMKKSYHFNFTKWTLPPSLTHLELVNTYCAPSSPLSDVLRTLRNLQALEVLSLSCRLVCDSGFSVSAEQVELPYLRYSALEGGMDDYVPLLDHLQFPSSTRIRLNWSLDDRLEKTCLLALADHIRRGPTLQSVHLKPKTNMSGDILGLTFIAWWTKQTAESIPRELESEVDIYVTLFTVYQRLDIADEN
ncbi:hypothetical protein NM688_g1497 [Phlebia brevispora]|uniref:Uncharacterized protein n=1 Tax=Phlebia brevispora TaxID=194682 RepID=A0ACC1TAZ3_9APHY|nr:hypothetical protein NM688_g1497 [Phlebia brevispora]